MQVSQKCQYALRAIFELARRGVPEQVTQAGRHLCGTAPAWPAMTSAASMRRPISRSARTTPSTCRMDTAIPPRFLEVILSQLKQGGFVESRRGNEGGYLLARPPARLTVGEVIRFIQGPLGPVECVVGNGRERCPLYGDCAFLPMWEKVRETVSQIYDSTTFEDLVEQARLRASNYVPSYVI